MSETSVLGPAVTSGWHLLDASYSGTTGSLFVDGSLAASTTAGYTPKTGSFGPLYFGGGEHGPSTLCDGELSQIAYYNVALPQSAIAAHFASAPGRSRPMVAADLVLSPLAVGRSITRSTPPSASDMGTGITARNGDTSLSDDPRVYDIDGILNSASTVKTLHLGGDKAVCYIEVGSAGNYYAQLSAAGDLGAKVPGYPEYYLDILNSSTVSIIESMLDQQCAAKGFDAVETDIDQEYGETSDFGLTKAERETYMTTLANYMHGLGLAWMIKDPEDTGDSYAADMESLADLVLTSQCKQYAACSLLLRRQEADPQRRVLTRDDGRILFSRHRQRVHRRGVPRGP